MHVTQWVDANDWNSTTRYNAIHAETGAFNRAIKEGRLAESPIRNVERPTPKRRESYLSKEQFEAVLNAAGDSCFKDFLSALFATRSRPQ